MASSVLKRAALNGARSFSSTRAVEAKIGFIGLGNMGRHMAANLLKKGHELTVFDVSAQAVADLKAKGASAASSASAAASGASVVITMLPSSPHVRSVYAGGDVGGGGGDSSSSSSSSSAAAAAAGGVFAAASPGALLIDCSTIDPGVSRALAAAAALRGMEMVDAPVSGGVGGAEKGTLTFMVGASSAAVFERASQSVLAHMGLKIVHCGGAGTGQVAKIVNNMVLGVSMNAVAEAMNLGVRMGADPKTLAGIINSSSGRCWSSDTYNPVPGVMPDVPSSKGYAGGFGSALMAKDLGLALEAGRASGSPLPTASAAAATYALMMAQGLGGKDFSAVYAFLAGQMPASGSR